jgi:hypothetical protein
MKPTHSEGQPNRFLGWGRRAIIAVSVVVVGLAVTHTPLASDLALRSQPTCELTSTPEMWWIGLHNPRHLISYSIICLLISSWFTRRRLLKSVAITLVLSGFLELQQAILADGHCRVRDMLPNVVALAGTALLWMTFAFFVRRFQRSTRP